MHQSHSRRVLSALPDAMRLPSGLNTTLYTLPWCPVSGGGPMCCADVGVPHPHGASQLPEMMRLPSGLNASAGHLVGVAGHGTRIGWPVAASHIRTVWSLLPVAMHLPSGLSATPGAAAVERLDWPQRPTPALRPSLYAGDDALPTLAKRHCAGVSSGLKDIQRTTVRYHTVHRAPCNKRIPGCSSQALRRQYLLRCANLLAMPRPY